MTRSSTNIPNNDVPVRTRDSPQISSVPALQFSNTPAYTYMGSWHLIGFCRFRMEPRIFLLSRIRKIDPLNENFKNRQFDVATFLENSFGIYKGEDVRQVSLRFSPHMSRMIQDEIWHRDQIIRENSGGGLILSVPVANLTEIGMKVLKYGAHVEVLEPEELRKQTLEEAKRIVGIYEKKG